MKLVLLFSAVFTLSFSVFAGADAQCGNKAPSNTAKLSGSKAAALFNSMDPMSAKSGSDSLGRIWFSEKSKSLEISECTVSDCTYTRSRVSRCVKGFNSQFDCTEQDETSYYCIDYR